MTKTDNEQELPIEKPSGSSWRALVHRDTETVSIENNGVLDELVVDDWLHLEKMQEDLWWLKVGDARILVEIKGQDSVSLRVERGFYGDISSFPDESAPR